METTGWGGKGVRYEPPSSVVDERWGPGNGGQGPEGWGPSLVGRRWVAPGAGIVLGGCEPEGPLVLGEARSYEQNKYKLKRIIKLMKKS